MSYADQITTEINALLDRLSDEGQSWRPRWIAHMICESHKKGLSKSKHAHFWLHCGYAEVRKQVGECISRRTNPAAEAAEEEAPRLPGFSHVREYYSVKRDDEVIGVPVRQLTLQEFDEKIVMLRKRAVTENAHANELEKLKRLVHFRDGEAAA
jgi:hypothetical protein